MRKGELDPYDIVADGKGHMYASSGSGQHTRAVKVDIDSGETTYIGRLFDGTRIAMHPDADRIYGADNGVSPSDLERYNIEDGFSYSRDSPYHGDYGGCGDLRIHPNGDAIHTRCGNVFLAANTSEDMTWLGSIERRWADLAFDPEGTIAYVIDDAGDRLFLYDADTFAPIETYGLPFGVRRIFVTETDVILLEQTHSGIPHTAVHVVPHDELQYMTRSRYAFDSVSTTWSSDKVQVSINGGQGTYTFGMAETVTDGWMGEDCYIGYDTTPGMCRKIDADETIDIEGTTDLAEVDEDTSLFPGTADPTTITYVLTAEDGSVCWSWGHDPTYYEMLGCLPPPM